MQARASYRVVRQLLFAIIPLHSIAMNSCRSTRAAVQLSWEQILANLDDGVIVVDAIGKIIFFNEASELLTDISSATAVGQAWTQIFKRESWLLDLAGRTRPPRQTRARGEGDLINRWGKKIPVSATVSPLQDAEGNDGGAVILLRDIRRRKELEEDISRADRLALIGTLSAGLAHEIRNPLGGIKGAAQLLRRTLDDASPMRDFTDIIIRETDRVNQLIAQLLDLSRPAQLELAPLNIHEVLEDVLLLESQAMGDKELHIKKWFDPSLPPILGDRAKLTQVFLNLVKNAFEAMQQGTVSVTTRLETDYHVRGRGTGSNRFIWVDVADEGSGIGEEELAHIFSPFFSTKNSGTGLGLATCYRIVKEHGGTIRVESAKGDGSVFRVSLLVAD